MRKLYIGGAIVAGLVGLAGVAYRRRNHPQPDNR
jgi:hypothetical protein